jgi:ubiquinone/menaquinone biosynthesis C-methylase UbiE
MPDELTTFQTTGPSWADRANAGELKAVLSPTGSEARVRFLNAINIFAAKTVLTLNRSKGVIVDFGCGTGRFVRFFAQHGYSVVGTEITEEMIDEATKIGIPQGTKLLLTDGIHIPLPDQSVDMIWCCGVLRFSLFVPEPVYQDIAKEMYRVLKPGGFAINVEMYVDNPPEIFTKDFEALGFRTKDVRVVHRYNGLLERISQLRFLPIKMVEFGGSLCAAYRYRFDSANRNTSGLRDYLFVWQK